MHPGLRAALVIAGCELLAHVHALRALESGHAWTTAQVLHALDGTWEYFAPDGHTVLLRVRTIVDVDPARYRTPIEVTVITPRGTLVAPGQFGLYTDTFDVGTLEVWGAVSIVARVSATGVAVMLPADETGTLVRLAQ